MCFVVVILLVLKTAVSPAGIKCNNVDKFVVATLRMWVLKKVDSYFLKVQNQVESGV